MTNELYLSTTYLKLLRTDPELMALLQTTFGSEFERLTQADYLYNEDIQKVFNAAVSAGIDSWLLHFGSKISVVSHGPLGFAVLSAPDLYTAMNTLIDFTLIRSSIYAGEVRQVGNRIQLIYHEQTGQPLIGRWLIESGLYVAQSLIETVMSHPLGDNATISFAYPEPIYAKQLSKFYGVKCEFDAAHNMLSIPASWSRISSPLSDPQTFSSNLQKCQELKRQLSHQDDVVETAKIELSRFFNERISGQTLDKGIPSLDSLADMHFCSTRTYARKLAEHQQSYKSLLEQSRRGYALDLLSTTHMSIADIALLLAYQEPANFVRAFKTWFDTTPAAWRKQPDSHLNKPKMNFKR
jgi:AraC-like DNA-binding protein